VCFVSWTRLSEGVDKMGEEEQPAAEDFADSALPQMIPFSSTVSKGSGGRFVIGVPAGFNALMRPNEAVNVTVDFIFRRVRAKQAQIDSAKTGLRKYKKPEVGE
jgi:hypothetical protein